MPKTYPIKKAKIAITISGGSFFLTRHNPTNISVSKQIVTQAKIWKKVQVPIPKNRLDTIVVTTDNFTPKAKPNNITEIMIMEVTGLKFGKNCKYILDAILTAANIAIKAISFTFVISIIVNL